jgi:transcription antitermination factor NusG
MEATNRKHSIATVVKTGDAVGVQERKWVIAIVTNNTEKKCGEKLIKMGYEAYVPTQQEIHRWSNGKTKAIDRVVLPSLVFIRVNESERKEIVTLSFIHKFMTNRAGVVDCYNRHAIATIPDKQIDTLKFMLYNSDTPVTIEPGSLKSGDRVRVIRGKLSGLEGMMHSYTKGDVYICVSLDLLGCAKVSIKTTDIYPIIN